MIQRLPCERGKHARLKKKELIRKNTNVGETQILFNAYDKKPEAKSDSQIRALCFGRLLLSAFEQAMDN